MKKRKIYKITYELLGELIGLNEKDFILDIISSSKERCSEVLLIKIGTNLEIPTKFYSVPEGEEIPRENYTQKRRP